MNIYVTCECQKQLKTTCILVGPEQSNLVIKVERCPDCFNCFMGIGDDSEPPHEEGY